MCRHVCPVARVTKRETTTPHGWALLIASVERGLLQWDADAVDTLYQCADCGLCEAHCVTDQPLPAAIVAARAEVVRLGMMPASVRNVDEALRTDDGRRQTVRPASDGTADGASRSAVRGLFVGSLPLDVVVAAQKLLNAMPLGVGRSSGYLPYTLGLWDTARMLVQQTLDEIAATGVRELVTLSTEDAHTFAHVFPALGITWPSDVRVVEFSDWAAAQIEQGTLRVQPRALGNVTYHDACHLARMPQRSTAARKLVAALTGDKPREMFWRGTQATPCGAIGGLQFTQPTLAAELARSRIREARDAGADIVLTDDPQCAAHLTAHADGLQVMNVVELLAKQMTTADGRPQTTDGRSQIAPRSQSSEIGSRQSAVGGR